MNDSRLGERENSSGRGDFMLIATPKTASLVAAVFACFSAVAFSANASAAAALAAAAAAAAALTSSAAVAAAFESRLCCRSRRKSLRKAAARTRRSRPAW